ncbi:putative inorganic phosphate cotransporter [Penaeus vannamei]|uniref:Sialin n=1 Tax=Penaeus vannamei TaxID=6689 RepID=A0A3R7MJA5_PENVA|nr:putative inorganic phosphate cotransporter [Penaeus vannamei]XP_027238193.1 putative inorganic phosphate cotransporter [Penaeus vannamei]XP_027238195.1 putative inorganic phosphate cotransporter [Penaeus vannamei]XP_027238196.1 putative inorganic phosphate cotransporter [Penaeus vannamei]XP_027238197.1 putative inorganic phosphate cotransporter [Penaeus vannamei]ROT84188.1 putative inorganic phosphate cotransporter [Penaeus vannamei]
MAGAAQQEVPLRVAERGEEEGKEEEGDELSDSGIYENLEWWGCRHTLCLMGLLGTATAYTIRTSLSMAIVAMVGIRAPNHTMAANTSAQDGDVCPIPEDFDASPRQGLEGEFDWDERKQGLILGSFFYGYASSNFLGGRAAEYLGGRLVYGLGISISALLTFITPFCARWAMEVLVVLRIVEGFAQGVMFPAINTMLATWTSPVERGKFTTFVHTGIQLGNIASLSLSGVLCSSGFLGGWPAVFYVFGALGLVWGVFWLLLVHDRPETHPRISPSELRHLRACKNKVKSDVLVPIPWREIAKSPPFWAIFLMNWASSYGLYTLMAGLPTYLRNIQHFKMSSSGLVSAAPYLSMWIVSIVWSVILDRLAARKVMSVKTVRRVSTAFASYGQTAFLLCLCLVECNHALVIGLLCAAVGASGTLFAGYNSSHQDIAPNLAGSLKGVTNTFGSVAGVVAPAVTGYVTQGNQTIGAWRVVFIVTAITYFVMCTTYLFLMTDKVQPWNEPEKKTTNNGDRK